MYHPIQDPKPDSIFDPIQLLEPNPVHWTRLESKPINPLTHLPEPNRSRPNLVYPSNELRLTWNLKLYLLSLFPTPKPNFSLFVWPFCSQLILFSIHWSLVLILVKALMPHPLDTQIIRQDAKYNPLPTLHSARCQEFSCTVMVEIEIYKCYVAMDFIKCPKLKLEPHPELHYL